MTFPPSPKTTAWNDAADKNASVKLLKQLEEQIAEWDRGEDPLVIRARAEQMFRTLEQRLDREPAAPTIVREIYTASGPITDEDIAEWEKAAESAAPLDLKALDEKLREPAAPTPPVWYCACGWTGLSGALKPNASGMNTCPDCGASGGLITKYPEPSRLVCTGCGSTQTIAEIRAEHPGAISCCPERNMQPCQSAAVPASPAEPLQAIEKCQHIQGFPCDFCGQVMSDYAAAELRKKRALQDKTS